MVIKRVPKIKTPNLEQSKHRPLKNLRWVQVPWMNEHTLPTGQNCRSKIGKNEKKNRKQLGD